MSSEFFTRPLDLDRRLLVCSLRGDKELCATAHQIEKLEAERKAATKSGRSHRFQPPIVAEPIEAEAIDGAGAPITVAVVCNAYQLSRYLSAQAGEEWLGQNAIMTMIATAQEQVKSIRRRQIDDLAVLKTPPRKYMDVVIALALILNWFDRQVEWKQLRRVLNGYACKYSIVKMIKYQSYDYFQLTDSTYQRVKETLGGDLLDAEDSEVRRHGKLLILRLG